MSDGAVSTGGYIGKFTTGGRPIVTSLKNTSGLSDVRYIAEHIEKDNADNYRLKNAHNAIKHSRSFIRDIKLYKRQTQKATVP